MRPRSRYPRNMEPKTRDAAETSSFDVVVIGAGPTGLACGIDAKRAGFTVTNIDKGCLVNSLVQLSQQHDVLHHAGAAGDRRHSVCESEPEAHAARGVWSTTERSRNTTGWTCDSTSRCRKLRAPTTTLWFTLSTTMQRPREYRARKLILATGYYDRPNFMKVPGEDLAQGTPLLPGAASVLWA